MSQVVGEGGGGGGGSCPPAPMLAMGLTISSCQWF